MTNDLKPYAAYKDSGVAWLGQVPEHWKIERSKNFVVNVVLNTDSKSEEEVYCALEHVESWTGRFRLPQDDINFESQVKHFKAGDILFGKLRPYLAKVVRIPRDGVCVSEFFVLRPKNGTLLAPYLEHLLRSKTVIDAIDASTFGAKMPRANWAFVGNMLIPIPTSNEQTAIVRYLEHTTRRIRRYIRAKQKLIKLLEEQKQAIIHQAVTGQIDVRTGQPYPAYKDSGVEWLGQVPEHWEVRRSKRTFSPSTELAKPDDIQLSATQAYGVIPQAEYEQKVGRKIVKILRHLDKRKHVEIDDFVISMRSFQGGLERAWASGCIRSSYVVLRAAIPLSADYFGYLFKTRTYIGALQSTANFIRDGQDLNFDNFSSVDLPFPSIEEQEAIAHELSSNLADITNASQKAKKEIDLLNEYRTRLIADVVTGKLDVREVAANLPVELDEADLEPDEPDDEPLDDVLEEEE